MTTDPAIIWAIAAFSLLAVGAVVYMYKTGFLENETHLDKMKKKGEG